MTTTTEPCVEFLELERERKTLEARIKEINERKRALEKAILDEWADAQQTQAKIDGSTIYLHRDMFCSKRGGVATEQLIEALRASGLEGFAKLSYSASQLKAWAKEQRDEETGEFDLPAALRDLLNVGELVSLRVRGA